MVQRLRPAALVLVATTVMTAGVLWLTLTPAAVRVNVRWTSTLSPAERARLETQFHLTDGTEDTGTTVTYILADRSTDNIRALVQHPAAEDTDGINRTRFRPFNAYQHQKRIGALAIGTGALAGLAWLLAPLAGSRARREWVLSPRVVVLTISVPPLLLIACSAVMLVGALLGIDPLWFSSQANPDRPGTTAPAPIEKSEGRCAASAIAMAADATICEDEAPIAQTRVSTR